MKPGQDIPEVHKVRPHRARYVGRIQSDKGSCHLIYVFKVPTRIAGNRELRNQLRRGCDVRAWTKKRGHVEQWQFVDPDDMTREKDRLKENEIGLLISRTWRYVKNFWRCCPRRLFYIQRTWAVDEE